MLRIALCDDDLNFMRELHQKIMQWYQDTEYGGNISITEFSDSAYLARTIRSGGGADLFFIEKLYSTTNLLYKNEKGGC